MSIKQLGGVFGRNPTFNDVTIEGQLTFDGDIDVNSDLKVDGDLEVTGSVAIGPSTADTLLHISGDATAIVRLENTNPGLGLDDVIGSIEFEKQDGSGAGAGVAGSMKLITSNNNGAESSLVFSTCSTARGNNAEAARFTSSGNLAFPSGQGIDFSATAGTGTSELLDDYEEGVWTPTLVRPSAGGFTYTPAVGDAGYYTKVGNICYVSATLGGTFSGGSGYYQINGLPFNNAGNGTALSVGNLANLSAGAAIGITVANVNVASTIVYGTPVSGNVHSFSAVYAV